MAMAPPEKKQKVDHPLKLSKRQGWGTRALGNLRPQELEEIFTELNTKSIALAKGSAYLHALQPGFSHLQDRYHRLRIHDIDQSEQVVVESRKNTQLKITAKVCEAAIRSYGDIMTAADAGKNQPTFLKAVELQAVFASVLITLLAGKEDLEQRFPGIKNLFQYLIEVLEANQDPHKNTATPSDSHPNTAAPSDRLGGCLFNMVTISADGLTNSTAIASSTRQSGDVCRDEYLEKRVKNHIADLSNMKIMDWDKIRGLEGIKEMLDDKMNRLRMHKSRWMVRTPTLGGVLIHGEQGTCKTSLVYAFAQRHNLPVFVVNSSIFGSLQGETFK